MLAVQCTIADVKVILCAIVTLLLFCKGPSELRNLLGVSCFPQFAGGLSLVTLASLSGKRMFILLQPPLSVLQRAFEAKLCLLRSLQELLQGQKFVLKPQLACRKIFASVGSAS